MQISNLRQYPKFSDTIADRGWNAWWTESGVPLEDYRAHLNLMFENDGIPAAFVAHDNDRYIGSALIIDNDLDERPNYAPWIAALWVEPECRKQGVATKLILHARQHVAALGHSTCYLCATTEKRSYYVKQGFTLLEEGVSGLDIFSIEAKLKMRFINPIPFVQDIARSKHFYEKVLGLNVREDFGDFVLFEGNFAIHEARSIGNTVWGKDITGEQSYGRKNLLLYFEHDDVDAAFQIICPHVELIHPINRQVWGQRVFRFYDPDGHAIEVGEPQILSRSS